MTREEDASKNFFRRALPRLTADLVLLFSFLFVSLRVVYDYRIGGDPWKQADWLINNAAGLIRRGPFGSAILSFSDLIGQNPLLVVSVLQISLLAALFLFFRMLLGHIRSPEVSVLLAVSSAIFTVFWVADPQGAVRKELIVFLGLTLYAVGALRTNWTLLWLGAAFFCISTLAHEAMVLFAPTFLAIAFFSGLQHKSAAQTVFSLATIFCFSIFALVFAFRHPGVEDTAQICAALTARGIDEYICVGAIKWMGFDSAHGFEQVISLLNRRSLAGFLLVYAAALAPFAYLVWLSERRISNGVVLLLLALPFLPLYIVAVDWGRWISFHVFSVTVVLICAICRNRLELQKPLKGYHVFGLVTLAVLISPGHTIGVVWGGALRRMIQVFWTLFS